MRSCEAAADGSHLYALRQSTANARVLMSQAEVEQVAGGVPLAGAPQACAVAPANVAEGAVEEAGPCIP
jgi:hypothetical protein